MFGFTRDATELMKKNCLKFGYKYYFGMKIEGDAALPVFSIIPRIS